GGAFYGGLRASEWKGRQASDPAAPTDPLKAGRAAFDQGNYPAAAVQFTMAVERDAQNPEAHYWLGRAQMETGDYAKAAASFENAVMRRPTLFDGYAQAAQAYELAGDRAKAALLLARGAEERRKAMTAARAENANAPR
ncbi:MAG TPA: tetratricopeptide repeat protein, partial [Blastocatellia bacterium]